MSTTQRSIAEVIGWEYTSNGYVRLPDGNTYEGYIKPTADDLLAWLRERSVHRIEMHYSKGWADVIVGDTYHEAPTLLAALEQAVRAVAGGS